MTKLEADDDDEAALLSSLGKGYKLKADGSKTSYFDRSDQVLGWLCSPDYLHDELDELLITS